jgi:hypothetical protein
MSTAQATINPFIAMNPASGNAVLYPHVVSAHFNVFISDNSLELDMTGLFAYVIANSLEINYPGSLTQHQPLSNPPAGAQPGSASSWVGSDYPRFSKGSLEVYQLTFLQQNADSFSSEELPILKMMLNQNAQNNFINMFSELIMCHQVSKLDRDNLDNYFASKDNSSIKSRIILQMLDGGQQIIPRLVTQPGSSALISSAPFLKYHTSASSTPTLIMKSYDDLGTLGDAVFTAAGISAARIARTSLHDLNLSKQIPDRDIAMAHAYLDAVGVLPNNWYQGKRAVDGQPPSVYKSWKVFFTKYTDLTADTDVILRQNDTAILATKMPVTMNVALLNKVILDRAATKQTEINKIKAIMDAEKLVQYKMAHANAVDIPLSIKTTNDEAFKILSRDA